MSKKVPVKDFLIGVSEPLCFISGPCVIESEDSAMYAAEHLKKLMSQFPVNFIYKSSYDKANRSSIDTFRGPGIEEGLRILQKVKEQFDIPVLTDVHSPEDARSAAQVCDVLQIPAFLCRQTDLVVAAAQTGAVINIKKGQFMAPWNMGSIVDKAVQSGNEKIILTDRGVTFGYNNLVSDMRAIPEMQKFGYPVCFDATHSVQLPGGLGTSSGGQRQHIALLAKCAVAAGANCLFLESHPSPKDALSDSASVMDFADLPSLLKILCELYAVVNNVPVLEKSF
ncbi:MAG: 3-deoxy-8-phosphooctulonate synthase [Parachlamydiales bacterium]|nr:3-deoxy-8-phosphooctulonate synthase [Parachlamydiales bacterium]